LRDIFHGGAVVVGVERDGHPKLRVFYEEELVPDHGPPSAVDNLENLTTTRGPL
jgi:hypothetical protein